MRVYFTLVEVSGIQSGKIREHKVVYLTNKVSLLILYNGTSNCITNKVYDFFDNMSMVNTTVNRM